MAQFAWPGIRFIYLFIHSETGSNARHFMNTILGASAATFPNISRASSVLSFRAPAAGRRAFSYECFGTRVSPELRSSRLIVDE